MIIRSTDKFKIAEVDVIVEGENIVRKSIKQYIVLLKYVLYGILQKLNEVFIGESDHQGQMLLKG